MVTENIYKSYCSSVVCLKCIYFYNIIICFGSIKSYLNCKKIVSTIISKAYELGKPSKVNYDYATDVNSMKLLEFGEGMKFRAVF